MMKKFILNTNQINLLKYSYLSHFPIKIPKKYFQDYESVIKYKELIKYAEPNKNILNQLLDITIEKIRNKSRYKKTILIILIRSQLKPIYIDKNTSKKLFFIFQSLILKLRSNITWSISILIRDIVLSKDNIKWLINNHEKSEHIHNRLLRYPKPNKDITKWGKCCLKERILNNRISELIGLQLNFNRNYTYKNKTVLIWGIHYSKLKNSVKKQLLLKHLTQNNFEEMIKICERNKYYDIIAFLYNNLSKIVN
jgi:hypothetical protein